MLPTDEKQGIKLSLGRLLIQSPTNDQKRFISRHHATLFWNPVALALVIEGFHSPFFFIRFGFPLNFFLLFSQTKAPQMGHSLMDIVQLVHVSSPDMMSSNWVVGQGCHTTSSLMTFHRGVGALTWRSCSSLYRFRRSFAQHLWCRQCPS